MKALRLFYVLSALLLGGAHAGVILDQDYVTRLKWAFQAYSDAWVGQEFTAQKSGQITRIEVDLGADPALQTDVTVHLINSRTGVRKTFVWPHQQIPRSTQYYLAGLDISGQNFQVSAGDVCRMVFTSSLPWGTRPAVSILGGCAAPEGVDFCSPGVGDYPRGTTLTGTSLATMAARDGDIGFRTFVANAEASEGAPRLFEGPEGMERWRGQRLWLPAFALGSLPITYSWYRNNQLITSGATPQFEVASAATEHAGEYYVVASNSFGSVTSRVAQVQILTGPMIQGSREVLAMFGRTTELNAHVVGIGPILYEWLFRGAVVGRSATYTIASPTLQHSGDYTLRATDSTGTSEWITSLLVRDDRSKIKWSRPTGDSGNPPTVAPSGKIYVARSNAIIEFTPAGDSRYFGPATAPQVGPIILSEIGVMVPERWGSVTAFDGSFVRSWAFPNSSPLFAVQPNGVGFLTESPNTIRCYNFATGESLWEKPFNIGAGFWPDPMYDPTRQILYITLERKRICAFDGRNGELMWDYRAEPWVQTGACIGADGTYYAASTNLFAFEAVTGRIKWQRALQPTGISVTADGRLFFCADGAAYSLNARTGETIWRKPFTRYGYGSPTLLADHTIVYVSLENLITALRMDNGELAWDCLIPGILTGPIAVGLDGAIYGTCWDGNLYALNTTAPLLPGPWSRTRGGTLNNSVMNAAAPPSEPVLIDEPADLTVRIGARARLQVSATSPTPLTYVWSHNGVEVPGASGTSLDIVAATWNDGGYYSVEVSNEFGRIRTRRARVWIDPGTQALVSVVAGNGEAGDREGSGEAARFNLPDGIAALDGSSVVVTDVNNHVLRKVDANGAVTRFAGVTTGGYRDGAALEALFTEPFGVFARGGDVFVADSGNLRVRRIREGSTTTIAGSGEAGYSDGAGPDAKFRFPNDLVADAAGNVFVTEFENHTVRRITPDGAVQTWAGTGVAGFRDGPGAQAQFNGPAGITLGPDGALFVTDWNNHRVRRIAPDRGVTTLAGSDAIGRVDGFGAEARLTAPNGIVYSPEGVLYITDFANVIRRVSLVGQVTTVAGNGTAGWADGIGENTRFSAPGGITWLNGELWVTDSGNHLVRRIQFMPATEESAKIAVALHPALTINGTVGKSYRIFYSVQLDPPHWNLAATVVLTTSPFKWFDPQAVDGRRRFYMAAPVSQ